MAISSSRHALGRRIGAPVIALSASCAHGQYSEHVLWRFELDSWIVGQEITVGPDGTIFACDDTKLYAINPDGTLKWTRKGITDETAMDVLPDGAIVLGFETSVLALNPDGPTRWAFTWDGNPVSHRVEIGPTIGPDGNIYVVASVSDGQGIGAFSLTPDGDLRWEDDGQPQLHSINISASSPVFFTSNHAAFGYIFTLPGGPGVYAYDFDGNQTLYKGACTGIPRADPFDRLIVVSGCGVQAVDPDGGEIFWETDVGFIPLLPVLDANGIIYTGSTHDGLVAVNPDGSILWMSPQDDADRIFAVSDMADRVLYAGIERLGDPHFVRGVDAADGSLVFGFDLLEAGIHNEYVWSNLAALSPDESVAYFTTRFSGSDIPGAVYAVALGASCPADFNMDGELNILDFVAFQEAFTMGDEIADCNVDGMLNILDFVCFQGLFRAGCGA